ncbi:hypothetical protein UYO_1466 [Lachnospiraceae bacterium JC7]|nr:hypothetical protein UYO_1466 [Lachnospiraceae bacterium JC7]
MFLNQLSYQEKKMFLDLSIHVAKANDTLAREEKELISAYCAEMQLPPIELYETEPIETVSDYFAMSELHVKKIVMLEILGLVYVDGSYDTAEESFIKKFANNIGITEEIYDNLHETIRSYYKVCKEMAEVVE